MQRVREPETDELFEIANLFPRTTGLPMTVWVSPRGNARHELRVKVNMPHGNQMGLEHRRSRRSPGPARDRGPIVGGG